MWSMQSVIEVYDGPVYMAYELWALGFYVGDCYVMVA